MKYVLHGCIATMDANQSVLNPGAIYMDGDSIAAVASQTAPAPAAFTDVTPIDTGGIVFPGLIELHNHLSYNALPAWQVPKRFYDRGQWQSNSDYITSVSSPMATIAKSQDPKLLAALARYVEMKCLLGGVTTSQGISLKTDDLNSYYHGTIRVVEDPPAPLDPRMPKAGTHIPDVVAKDWAQFNAALDRASCLLLHLAEGLDETALNAFLALQQNGVWAINSALAGIHCAALQRPHFDIMAQHQASMIWSPLSNLMLYGGTSDVASARAAGVAIALGSDWSPTGSKNLLNELKIAKAVNEARGLEFADAEIVAMATSVPAKIAKWDKAVGSLAPGWKADLLVVAGDAGDPYGSLIAAKETDVRLVIVDGRPTLGSPALMNALGATGERLVVGSQAQLASFGPPDPNVPAVSFADSARILDDALSRLPTLLGDEASGRGAGGARPARGCSAADATGPRRRAFRTCFLAADAPTQRPRDWAGNTAIGSSGDIGAPESASSGSTKCHRRSWVCGYVEEPVKHSCGHQGGFGRVLSVRTGPSQELNCNNITICVGRRSVGERSAALVLSGQSILGVLSVG